MNPDSRPARVPRWLMLIAAMTAVGPVSIDMYLPGFPLIEHEFGERGVERTMASYLVGIVFGQLLYGPISDRFGRKPPLYAGFALYALGALGCAFANSMSMLMSMRVLQALGGGAGVVIGRAIVRDRCQPHEAARAFSILMMIVALGPIVAPTLGGWVVTVFGWRAVFIFQTLVGISLMIAMHTMMTESRNPAHVVPLNLRQVGRSYVRLLKDRSLLGYSMAGGFGMGALFCYVAGSPTVMTQLYDLSPQQFGWMIGLNGIAFMSASRINMVSLRYRGPDVTLAHVIWLPVFFGVLLTTLAIWIDLPLWAVMVMQFGFFISVGCVTPNVAALALAPHGREAGVASALMGALQSGLATLAGVAVAVFNDDSIGTLALLMTVGAVCGWLSYLWVRRRVDET